MSREKRSNGGVRWGRAILAGFLAEATTILLIVAVLAVYSKLIAPGRSVADYEALGARAGSLLGPIGGALLTFLYALWAARPLERGFLAQGLVVAAAAVLLHLASLAVSRTAFEPIFAVADAMKFAGGLLGGLVAQRTHGRLRM